MKLNQSLMVLTTTMFIFQPAHANVRIFHPGKHKTDVSSMKEDIEHNRDQIFTDGIKINSLELKVNDQDVKINFNKQQIDEYKEKIKKNTNAIDTNKENIEKHQQLIDNNERNTIINEMKTKENKKRILVNTADIIKNNRNISDVKSLISENTTKINQLDFNQQRFETKTEHKFAAMDKRIGYYHHKAMAGVSSAMSMSAIPFVEGKRFSFGFGAGSYGGQGAVSFGSQFRLSEQIRSSAYMSYDSNKSIGVAAGISFGW
ncbi:hypothetical protein GJV14_23560 [Enterobacteriaceae bacterium RIT697]|nr:hypothetical protein [Enterobacteriaceae bacterium RIT697]